MSYKRRRNIYGVILALMMCVLLVLSINVVNPLTVRAKKEKSFECYEFDVTEYVYDVHFERYEELISYKKTYLAHVSYYLRELQRGKESNRVVDHVMLGNRRVDDVYNGGTFELEAGDVIKIYIRPFRGIVRYGKDDNCKGVMNDVTVWNHERIKLSKCVYRVKNKYFVGWTDPKSEPDTTNFMKREIVYDCGYYFAHLDYDGEVIVLEPNYRTGRDPSLEKVRINVIWNLSHGEKNSVSRIYLADELIDFSKLTPNLAEEDSYITITETESQGSAYKEKITMSSKGYSIGKNKKKRFSLNDSIKTYEFLNAMEDENAEIKYTMEEPPVITLYLMEDRGPKIVGADFYVPLELLKNTPNVERLLANYVKCTDDEDGKLTYVSDKNVDTKGVHITICYSGDLSKLNKEESFGVKVTACDSAHNKTQVEFRCSVVDTSAKVIKQKDKEKIYGVRFKP